MHRGASTWASVPSGMTSTINTVWGSGPNDVWIGGANGEVARWNGTSFVAVATGLTSPVTHIAGRAANDVLVVFPGRVLHWNGAAFRTVDVGSTGTFAAAWTSPTTPDAWVVGPYGLARRKVA